MIDFRYILIFNFLFLIPNIVTFSYGQESQINDKQDIIRIIRDIGIPLITLLAGIISAKYIVGSWQKRKEISDIRNEILKNYTNSFKNYITLLDTFVAKLVMEFAQLTNGKPSDKTTLSELLPWGFTFNDLNYYYSKKFPPHKNLTDFKNQAYKEKDIIDNFKNLEDVIKESYINFEVKKLNEFKNKNEVKFKNDFYRTRNKLMGFKANLHQYYEDSTNLSYEFSAMWEYMMGCYVLVNKILKSEDEPKFIELLKEYNTLANFLFDMMINFERKLIGNKIDIERKHIMNMWKRLKNKISSWMKKK